MTPQQARKGALHVTAWIVLLLVVFGFLVPWLMSGDTIMCLIGVGMVLAIGGVGVWYATTYLWPPEKKSQ